MGKQSLGGFPEAGFLACQAFLSWQTHWCLTMDSNPLFFLPVHSLPMSSEGAWIAIPGRSLNQIRMNIHMKIPSEIWNDLNSLSRWTKEVLTSYCEGKRSQKSPSQMCRVFVCLFFFSRENERWESFLIWESCWWVLEALRLSAPSKCSY